MFFLQYRTTPLPDRLDVAAKYGGAIVDCWIDRETALEAESVAKKMIETQGWQVRETLEVAQTSEEDFAKSAKLRQYYEQAVLDKEVVVFFTYPLGETRS
jgi:hypothetical protein